AVVPAPVVVRAVAILLAVGFVVLVVVGDDVVQGEAVVAGDEVDAVLDFALLVPLHVRAAPELGREGGDRAVVAADEAPDVVAEAAVPLLPGVADEGADLVEPGGIPGLG